MNKVFDEEFGILPHSYLLKNILDYNFQNEMDQKVLDLVDVITCIYFNDITIARTPDITRNFNLVIPVSDVSIWNQCKHTLIELVKFVSRDKLKIEFVKKTKGIQLERLQLDYPKNYNNVSLLSGGLDSFCGSFVNIQNGFDSIYVGYRINKFEQNKQDSIKDFIRKQHRKSLDYFFKKIEIAKEEYTQATRSLLFLSLACSVAYVHKIPDVYIYENGVLSLNPVKNGRFTTKTTHPKTITLYNKILSILGLEIKISNPFLFLSKGVIIDELNTDFKNKIKDTHTCAIGRQNIHLLDKKKQCGFCIPCVLRKISLAAYNNEKYDVEYEVKYGAKLASIKDLYQASEYKSSVEYFKTYKTNIDNGHIYHFLGLKDTYYFEKDYLKRTDEMLRIFSLEVERFLDKYDIY